MVHKYRIFFDIELNLIYLNIQSNKRFQHILIPDRSVRIKLYQCPEQGFLTRINQGSGHPGLLDAGSSPA